MPYFPPEYFDTGRYHAKPATVFSLGVLLIRMILGRFPTANEVYHLINNDWSRFVVSQGEMLIKEQMVKDSMCTV